VSSDIVEVVWLDADTGADDAFGGVILVHASHVVEFEFQGVANHPLKFQMNTSYLYIYSNA
jgi:hypothetical protein